MTKALKLKKLVADESTMVISMGDKVKINMKVVKASDNSPSYIKLVNDIIIRAKPDSPIVISVNNDYAELASDKFDALLGTVRVPLRALSLAK